MAGRAGDFERGTDADCSFAHTREAEAFFLTAERGTCASRVAYRATSHARLCRRNAIQGAHQR